MATRTLGDWQDGQARGDDDEKPDGSEKIANVLHVPLKARVVLPCPDCGDEVVIDAQLFGRRTKDSDGTTTLTLRTKAAKVSHSCGQLTLDSQASGPLTR